MSNHYHYAESGLDNIYLANGFSWHETPYGRGIAITDVEGLHRTISRWIVRNPARITGAELRFLRKELDLSQRELAARMGATEQQVFRWEKARRDPIPGMADRLVRILYNGRDNDNQPSGWIMEYLADLDVPEKNDVTLEETQEGWKVAA